MQAKYVEHSQGTGGWTSALAMGHIGHCAQHITGIDWGQQGTWTINSYNRHAFRYARPSSQLSDKERVGRVLETVLDCHTGLGWLSGHVDSGVSRKFKGICIISESLDGL